MVFDNGAFSDFVSDSRYELLRKPLKIDKDNKAYEIQVIPPATARGTYLPPASGNLLPNNATGINLAGNSGCWNADGSVHYIDVFCGSDFKANFQGTGLLVKYFVVQGRVTNGASFWGQPIAPILGNPNGVGCSLPWNPTYMFQTLSLKVNQSQTPVEQYVNQGNLQHITTPRFLLKYKREGLERNSQTFFTPCIESKFDNATISTESGTRANNWMGAVGLVNDAVNAGVNATIGNCTYYKFIPLSDLFECCEVPAVWCNVNRFRLEMTFRTPDNICFQCGVQANSTPCYFYVQDIKLLFDCTRMQAVQAIETAVERQQGTVENIGYLENHCVPINYGQSSQIVVTGQRDVQQVIVGFPAVTIAGGANVNPTQYDNGSLTSINLLYGSDMPLRSPMTLSDGFPIQNVQAYSMYRKACGADRAPLVAPALDMLSFPFYHLYFFPIYYPSMPHRNNDPRDVRVDNNSTAAGNRQIVAVIRRFNGAQISSDGNIDKL
jgi:hypothetical protein